MTSISHLCTHLRLSILVTLPVLKEDQYDQVIAIFEQYATDYLKGTLDYANLQASIENLVFSEEQDEQTVEPIW